MTTWHFLTAKVATNFADKGGSSVGTVRSRTKAMGFSLLETKAHSLALQFFIPTFIPSHNWCILCRAATTKNFLRPTGGRRAAVA
jgi:hypothetical protein